MAEGSCVDFITVCQRSWEKLMFSQVSVSHCVQGVSLVLCPFYGWVSLVPCPFGVDIFGTRSLLGVYPGVGMSRVWVI